MADNIYTSEERRLTNNHSVDTLTRDYRALFMVRV